MKKTLKVIATLVVVLVVIAGGFYWNQTKVTLVETVPLVLLDEAGLSSDLVADTTLGKVLGYQHDKGVIRFSRIPFAQAPMGKLRYMSPKPLDSWQGVLDTRDVGPSCLQATNLLSEEATRYQSEDCLSAIVTTPKLDGKKRPVMVWVHGGGLTVGSASEAMYDGSNLAARGDVVVVSLQYRLGALGWLTPYDLGDDAFDGQLRNGQLDALAGLQWVRDNIAAFGGDPDNVTIFGESAGSFLVASILAMPEADDLIDKVILQSGVVDIWPAHLDRRQYARQVMDDMGVESLAELRTLDSAAMREFEEITFAMAEANGFPDPMLWYEMNVTADEVIKAAERGKPVMHGTMEHEYHLFLGAYPIGDAYQQLKTSYINILKLSEAQAEALFALGQQLLPQRSADDAMVDTFSALLMHYPHTIVSDQYGQQAPAYQYMVDWQSPGVPEWGAFHALELPFVFGNLDAWGFALGDNPPQQLANDMMDAWTTFARTGNPSHQSIGEWPQYNQSERPVMVFGDNTRLEKDPLARARVLGEALKAMKAGR